MHMEKFKAMSSVKILEHVTRSKQTKTESNIDYSKTHLNVDLMPPISKTELMQLNKTLAKRKDAVTLVDTVLTLPEELKHETMQKQIKFFKIALEGMQAHIGGKPVFATIHFDETTPHLHYGIVPLTQDGRLCAKELINKNMMKRLHPAVTEHIQSKGIKLTLYEQDDELRQLYHDLGKSKLTMEQYRAEQRLDKALEERVKALDKSADIAHMLTQGKRSIKRQKGESRAEYRERRQEWVEIRKEEYELLKSFKMQTDSLIATVQAEDKAQRAEMYLKVINDLRQETILRNRESIEAKKEMEELLAKANEEINKRAKALAEETTKKMLHSFFRSKNASVDYTERLEDLCKQCTLPNGKTIYEHFRALEKALEEEAVKSVYRGWTR